MHITSSWHEIVGYISNIKDNVKTKENAIEGLSGELSRQTTDHTWSWSKLLRPKQQPQQVLAQTSPAEVAGLTASSSASPSHAQCRGTCCRTHNEMDESSYRVPH